MALLSSRRPAAARIAQRLDDLGRCGLQLGQMACGEFLDREGRLDPENVDRAVNPRAVQYRNGNRGKSIVSRRTSVAPSDEVRIARAVALLARLGENPVEPFGVAGEPVFRLIGFA